MIIRNNTFSVNEGSELYEEGLALSGNECNDFFTEGTGNVALTPCKEPPEDFKKSVLRAVKKGYELSDRGIGTNAMDAGLATFGILYRPFLKKAVEKIE